MKLWRVISPMSMRIGIIICCTNISVVFSQTENAIIPSQKELDSIFEYYELSNKDSLKLHKRSAYASSFLNATVLYKQDSLIYKGLMQKTWLLGKTKQYDSAIIYSHKLYDLARQNKDTFYIKNALLKLGIYHKKNDEFAKAFRYYNENFKILRELKDTIRAGRSLLNMANMQTMLGDYSGSKTTAIDGLKYVESTKDLISLSGLYHIISVANRKQNNYKEAFKYNSLASALGKDTISANSIGVSNVLKFENTKALILADTKDYNQALFILSELQENTIVQNNKKEYARVIGNLGYVQWLQNKDNEISEELFLEALEIRKEIQDVDGLFASNIYLANFHLNKNKTTALRYAEAARKNALKINSLTSIKEALELIIELKDNVREEAIALNSIYNKIDKINQSNREIYAVTKYENENLTNQNLLLEAANAQLAIEKAKEERENIIYLLGTVILILSGGFVFYLLQQKHKRERIRDVFKAETRISKKLHDELANDVYHVMTQIQNVRNDQEVLDKLENIYSRTRDFSRENSSFKLDKNYTQELSGMLSSYGSDTTKIIIKDIDDVNWSSITPEKKIIIHRIIQELMVNMKKHSQATLVAVTFKKAHKTIEISYADNGIGVSKNDIIYSSGLQNAENRIKTIGGSFIFDSEEGKGFKARIQFPS